MAKTQYVCDGWQTNRGPLTPTPCPPITVTADPDLKYLKSFANVGAPWSVCTSPAPNQYLFSGDGNGKIYKLDLDGTLLGWAQTSQGHGQAGCLVHEIHCESDTVIYKGDCSTWTVEKITIKGSGRQAATR